MEYGDGAALVRELAETLPEAYEGIDLADEYGPDEFGPTWLPYIAFPEARWWIEQHAIAADWRAQTVRVLRAEPLERYFGLLERWARDGDGHVRTLVMIEAFEGTPWVQDALGPRPGDRYPHLTQLLDDAQEALGWCNGAIGRWPEPGR